jgi:hypothetical protein
MAESGHTRTLLPTKPTLLSEQVKPLTDLHLGINITARVCIRSLYELDLCSRKRLTNPLILPVFAPQIEQFTCNVRQIGDTVAGLSKLNEVGKMPHLGNFCE